MKNYVVGDGPVGISLASMLKSSCLVVPDSRLAAHQATPPSFKREGAANLNGESILSFEQLCKSTDSPKTIWLAITARLLHSTVASLLPSLTNHDTLMIASNGLDLISDLPTNNAATHRITISYPVQFHSVLAKFAAKDLHDSVVEMAGTTLLRVGLIETTPHHIKEALKDFEVTYFPSVKSMEWHKALINSSLNPLTVILHCRNNQILANPHIEPLMLRLISEITAVGNKEGVTFTTTAEEILATGRAFSGDNINGSLAAVIAGKPDDFDFNIGRVLKHAKRYGIHTPALEIIYGLLMGVLKNIGYCQRRATAST